VWDGQELAHKQNTFEKKCGRDFTFLSGLNRAKE
jgi:hypothetical protein